MRLHSFTDSNGKFDYEKYRRIQEEGNIRKIKNVWADENVIHYLAKFAAANLDTILFGLCHGTRRGLEQAWFSKYTGAFFLGTEISSTATDFPNTIQWDFHNIKDDWIESVDVIYSNSWDHSYDPSLCFTNWMRCLRPGGFCFLEHASVHGDDEITELDPFGISLPELVLLLTDLSRGVFYVRGIISEFAFERPKYLSSLNVVVVEKALGGLVFP
jgi:hypothetical protein